MRSAERGMGGEHLMPENEPELKRNPGFARDLLRFLAENRKWWLYPVVVVVLLMGLLIVLGATPAAPFIYSLF